MQHIKNVQPPASCSMLSRSHLSCASMLRSIGKRCVVIVGTCVVLCSLLTALLVEHRSPSTIFGKVHETRRYVMGTRDTFSQVSTSGQLPFVNVVVVATSALGWADRRARVRAQFPRNMKLLPRYHSRAALLKFAIGTQGLADDRLAQAHAEASEFSDLLLLNCLDEDIELKHPPSWQLDAGVSSTTSKVMLSVQWAIRHFDFQYYFRLGDDSYFRVDRFVTMLSSQSLPMHNAVVGHIMTDRVFGMDQLYPQGMGYGMTYDVCQFIASNQAYLLNTAPEDCVVARWLFALGARFVDSPLWLDIHMGDSCTDDMILAHKLPAELWQNISEIGTISC